METIFRRTIGDTPKIRVLEFLIEGRELDYSISDIAEGAEIGRTTLFRIWGDLVDSGILIPTRNIGNAKLYKLNIENPFVKKMIGMFDTLVIEPLNKRKKVVVKSNNFERLKMRKGTIFTFLLHQK